MGTYQRGYALHSLLTSLIHSRYGIPKITEDLGVEPAGAFARNVDDARQTLLAMAQAHEAKEIEGPFQKYIWGADRSTDRKIRRTARVTSMLMALGMDVPVNRDAE